jgi:hypothetical protein
MNELKVIEVYNDSEKFENEVNGYCCNCDYNVLSCNMNVVREGEVDNILYVAFLGKNTRG